MSNNTGFKVKRLIRFEGEVTTIEGNIGGRVVRRQYERGAVPRLLGYGVTD